MGDRSERVTLKALKRVKEKGNKKEKSLKKELRDREDKVRPSICLNSFRRKGKLRRRQNFGKQFGSF